MPGTFTVNAANQVLTPLVLSTAEDTYTITAGRDFTVASPLVLRVSIDTNALLIGYVTTGPYLFQPASWTNDFRFSLKSGQTLVLFVKSTLATPTLYLSTVADPLN